ncbi:MAG TPA: S-adenosylmethionine:tRNA ribosyltransferase-isomerase, partial [Myxococcota bacterium]|nr:S-adenosylmethionine:tRNA ribosyltransferase-isomerase [Myxococcota bacterium]
ERYQTVYADAPGAVAAPTAGLHFTPELLDDLERAGVEVARITLHVGPGTFKPIAADDVRRHDVGLERYRVAPEAAARINRALDDGRRVIAVGTTVTRTLEAAGATGRVVAGEGATRLLIVPGHRFRVVSGLVTNFHLPGSSLIVLVSAFAGRRRVLAAYRRAVASGYRFYSYGDAMLVL